MDECKFFRIIIPTYNGGRYLPRMVESIRAQTCDDYHLIIADDMSTDDTANVARELDPDLLITLCSKGYAAGARNKAMQHCMHDMYTLWFDDDDRLIDIHALEKIKQCAIENNYPDIIRFNWIATRVSTGLPGNHHERFPKVETPETICMELFGGMPWCKAVKTSKCVEFPEELVVDDCFHHIMQCDNCETAAVIHDDLYEWLIREGSITTKPSVMKESGWYLEIGMLMRRREYMEHEWAKKAIDERIKIIKKRWLKGVDL